MLRLHRLIPFIALAAGLSAHARPVYVDQNASGTTHDGLSWATAFLRVADGLAVATSEDEVWVARGTYLESVTLGSKQSMYGGFAGTETQREQRDWKANPTVLDGGTSGLDVVTCGFRTVVDGFGIRHGQNGITVAAGATATLANNTIADSGYDGVYVDSASAVLSGSTISGAAVHGVQVHLCTVAVTGTSVSANRRFGIAMTSGTVTLTSSTISGNGEAGVWVSSSSATLNNSTITANAIGVDVYQGSARLTNSIVAFNSGVGLIAEAGGSLPTFISNDIYGNAGGDYSGYTPPEGQGNMSVDPKLSNPYHDVHIQPDSPCRDAGDTAAATGATDIDGQPRVQGAAVDLGSDESDGTVWPASVVALHVSPSGQDASDGLTWASAKRTVGAALAVAQGGDEIWVARGTYQEEVVVRSGQALYGGFAGGETEREQRDWKTNSSVLDGGGAGKPVVTCEGQGAVVDGMVLLNGLDGVNVNAASARVVNCTVTGNALTGLELWAGTATFADNVISGNSTSGIDVYDGTLTAARNTVTGNGTVGVYVGSYSTAVVSDSLITGNGSSGVYLNSNRAATVSNNTITANGTGIGCSQCTGAVNNNIVGFNTGYGLAKVLGATVPTLSHNDVYGNTSGDYSGYTPPEGQGNISVDPKLSSLYHDVHIQPDSPCRDAGDSALAIGPTDIEGQPRVQGAAADIGSDESDGTAWPNPSVAWHVSPVGDDTADGLTWKTAKRTVDAALSVARGQDEVWVAMGTYTGNISPGPGVALYGGFAGTEDERGQRDWAAHQTVLDGGGSTQPVVTCSLRNTVVDGFTIRNGSVGVSVTTNGRAALTNCTVTATSEYAVNVNQGTVAMANCIVSGNAKFGVYSVSGSISLADSVVADNGAAGLSAGGPATITHNVIARNYTGLDLWGTATLVNNTVSGNRGSGVTVGSPGTATLTSNTITGSGQYGAYVTGTAFVYNNTLAGNNTGLFISYSSKVTLTNNTISGSSVDGVWVDSGSVALSNNIVAFNERYGVGRKGGTLTIVSSDVYGNAGGDYSGYTPPEGQGNMSVDPKLSNPYHDVHIQPDSPCRDAGDTAAATGATDIDGQPRVQGAAVDIGSDESEGTVWAVPSITWHVSPGGDDAFDGRSWAAAKRTITGALAAAQAGDEVWVAGGVYDQAVSPGPWLALYGGFAGTETERDQRDWIANPTILDGGGRSGPVVTCAFGSTRVDGFSIRNGVTGILLSGYATGAVTHNMFTGNGDHGIYVDRRASVTLAENASFGNGKDGIGILGTATVSNNTIAGNGRDGLYVSYGKATLINNIVAFNGSYGVESVNGATATLRRNDVYGNAQNLSYNVFPNPRDGNLMRDPLFADRAGLDFRLTLGSPCRGAGDDSAVASGETDLDGRPRIIGAHVDMGAYEYDASGLAPFFLPDVAKALGISAGLIASSPDDVSRLNVEPTSAGVDIRDASRVARKVAGLDPNP